MFMSGQLFRTFAQFLFKMNFSRGAGGSAKRFGNSEGVGVGWLFFFKKKWKFRRGGGSYLKFPLFDQFLISHHQLFEYNYTDIM